MPYNDASAREQLMARPTGAMGFVELSRVGADLDPHGPPLDGGANPEWIKDILQVAVQPTWKRTLDRNRKDASEPFTPYVTRFDSDGKGFRSFAPDDLQEEAEQPLRELAALTKNMAVAARIYDVLHVRFGRHQDAAAAINAYLRQQEVLSGDTNWSDRVQVLGRLAVLVTKRRDKSKLDEVLNAFESAGSQILAGSLIFAFSRLADTVLGTILSNAWARRYYDGSRTDRWLTTLGMVATYYEKDHHHGQNALTVLAAWV